VFHTIWRLLVCRAGVHTLVFLLWATILTKCEFHELQARVLDGIVCIFLGEVVMVKRMSCFEFVQGLVRSCGARTWV
jgi:hypothetical protein